MLLSRTRSRSSPKVTYGHEQTGKVTATVRATWPTAPSGTVTIRFGSVTACTITLRHATGTCMLALKRFKPGTYKVSAAYRGDANFNGSTASKPVTVTS
jgi:hypothetical protein